MFSYSIVTAKIRSKTNVLLETKFKFFRCLKYNFEYSKHKLSRNLSVILFLAAGVG